MLPIRKVAIFLMIIGEAKGQRIIALLDNDEIKAIMSEIRNLTAISPEVQDNIRKEFAELGYDDSMKAVDVLTVIRQLFAGSKIGRQCKR